jgi:hypothetical protein
VFCSSCEDDLTILLTSDGEVRQERSQKYLQKLLVTSAFRWFD